MRKDMDAVLRNTRKEVENLRQQRADIDYEIQQIKFERKKIQNDLEERMDCLKNCKESALRITLRDEIKSLRQKVNTASLYLDLYAKKQDILVQRQNAFVDFERKESTNMLFFFKTVRNTLEQFFLLWRVCPEGMSENVPENQIFHFKDLKAIKGNETKDVQLQVCQPMDYAKFYERAVRVVTGNLSTQKQGSSDTITLLAAELELQTIITATANRLTLWFANQIRALTAESQNEMCPAAALAEYCCARIISGFQTSAFRESRDLGNQLVDHVVTWTPLSEEDLGLRGADGQTYSINKSDPVQRLFSVGIVKLPFKLIGKDVIKTTPINILSAAALITNTGKVFEHEQYTDPMTSGPRAAYPYGCYNGTERVAGLRNMKHVRTTGRPDPKYFVDAALERSERGAGTPTAIKTLSPEERRDKLDELLPKMRKAIDMVNSKRDGEYISIIYDTLEDVLGGPYQTFSKKTERKIMGDHLANVGGAQALTNYLKFLMNGKHTEEQVQLKCLHVVRSLLWNFSDASFEFCREIGKSGLLTILSHDLANMECADLKHEAICLVVLSDIAVMHNCAKVPENRHFFQDIKAVDRIRPYLQVEDLAFKVPAVITMAYIVEDRNISLIEIEDSVADYIINTMKEALSSSDMRADGYSVIELAMAFGALARNDANKELLTKKGGLELLIAMAKDGDSTDKEQALKALQTFLDNPDIKKQVNNDRDAVTVLNQLKEHDDHAVKKAASDVLQTLQKSTADLLPAREYFYFIKEKVVDDWEDLAYKLEFEPADIDNIKGKEKDAKSCCRKMLNDWYKRKGNAATINILMATLAELQLQFVVDGLRDTYPELREL